MIETLTQPQPVEQAATPAVRENPSRLFFLDHLRAALVVLVVLHHVAVMYGEGRSFYYVEPPPTESLTYLVLLVFVLLNQSWFMRRPPDAVNQRLSIV